MQRGTLVGCCSHPKPELNGSPFSFNKIRQEMPIVEWRFNRNEERVVERIDVTFFTFPCKPVGKKHSRGVVTLYG